MILNVFYMLLSLSINNKILLWKERYQMRIRYWMHSACSHLPQTITNSSQEIYDKACRNTRTTPHSRIQLIMKILISNISSKVSRLSIFTKFTALTNSKMRMTLRNLIESTGFPRTNQSITYISSTNNSHSPTNINRTKEKTRAKIAWLWGGKKNQEKWKD